MECHRLWYEGNVNHERRQIADQTREQLQHVHLLSNFRFPTVAHMTVEAIVDYLLQAPNITRHTAPMNWTYLDAPADGTVLLVWQPSQLGNHFASDGYIWADPEQAFSLDAKGYVRVGGHSLSAGLPSQRIQVAWLERSRRPVLVAGPLRRLRRRRARRR